MIGIDRMVAILMAGLTWMDWAALIAFGLLWLSYAVYADRAPRSPERAPSLNALMWYVRSNWMSRMLERDLSSRIIDVNLLGHTIQSISFFASTTMIVLAGLIGLMGSADHVYQLATGLGLSATTSLKLFELKLLGLVAIFVYAFFKFTWALRQYNYCCALIGAAPPAPLAEDDRRRYAAHAATMLSLAITNFNRGLRGYYAALAWLGWFLHPLIFFGIGAWMILTLLRRQRASRSLAVVRAYMKESE
ncbi:MAG TPA: DUF599 domain-containing protein [Dongiaceae bacterium]|jgi:uncharacterized membrane protein|nr:DUF599 domain-containing protein [Dongiaceae bacterium]